MSVPVFESVYRNNMWRIGLSEYEGQRRLSIWSHYRDRETGEWKPCGGKREAPGFIVPPDRADELAAILTALAEELRSSGAASAA